MNSDIRVSVNFVQHPKTKKTIRKYGHAAVVSLIALWGFAAQRRPEGNLTGMDVDDIAIAACWDGDEQEFFDMCVSMKWIDVHENGEIHLHGWKEAQGEINKEKSGRELDVTASEWQALRKAVFERDGYRCQYCGKIVESPQCDHVFPFSRGGRSTMDNLVTACPRCNMSKHAKTPEEWRQFKANSMRKWGCE